ncbi:MAG: hypothetical protein ACK4TB_04865 [Gemmobacter sp.]
MRDYTALLATGPSQRWNAGLATGTPVFVTYSFVESADLPALADYNPYNASAYDAFSDAQRANTRAALAQISGAFGVTFVETGGEGMVNIFASSGASFAGWANYPQVSDSFIFAGRLVINRSDDLNPGTGSYQVLLHEIGHALGLKHPFEGDVRLADDLNTTANTLMSYGWSGGPYSSFSPLDVAALEHLYGRAADLAGWVWGFADAAFAVRAAGANDTIVGVRGANRLEGMGGADTILGGPDGDTILGGGGNDSLRGRAGDDSILGGSGHDTIEGGRGNDTIRGGPGNDLLIGDGEGEWGMDAIWGGAGRDTIRGGGGADTLRGDAGNDLIEGGDGNDLIEGGEGADALYGGGWSDTIFGGGGKDRIWGGEGFDTIFGGAGDDRIWGGEGSDDIDGGEGNDIIRGVAGINRLRGGAGADTLIGGADFDYFYGGAGNDRMTGGAGPDRFVFGEADRGGLDRVTDYEPRIDQFDLRGMGFLRSDIAVLARGNGDAMLSVGGKAGIRVILTGVAPEDVYLFDVFV